jgi:hypothetical protein
MLASGLAFCGDNSGTCHGAPVTAMGWNLLDTFGGGNDLGAMDNFSIPAVQEPSRLALLASGLVGGLAALRRKIR